MSAPATDDERIYDGDYVAITKVPWQVGLFYRDTFRCGGSIISNRWILTSANCTKSLYPGALTVGAGSDDLSKTRRFKVAAIKSHEKYSYLDYDIALVQLSEELVFDTTIRPIRLADNATTIAAGTRCLVSGWGAEKYGGGTSRLLQAARVPISSDQVCWQRYGTYFTPRIICAGVGYLGDGEYFGAILSATARIESNGFSLAFCSV